MTESDASVLGVDPSPLRATKGGSLRGGGSGKRSEWGGPRRILLILGCLFRVLFVVFSSGFLLSMLMRFFVLLGSKLAPKINENV